MPPVSPYAAFRVESGAIIQYSPEKKDSASEKWSSSLTLVDESLDSFSTEASITLYQGFRAIYPTRAKCTRVQSTDSTVEPLLKPYWNSMSNVSVLFSKLVEERDDLIAENDSLNEKIETFTSEWCQIEDVLTRIMNRKSEIKANLKNLLLQKDRVSDCLLVLDDKINEIGKTSLDFEKKIRSLKGFIDLIVADSEMVQKSAAITNSIEPLQDLKTLFKHGESVECLSFDIPFGTLVTGSADKTMRIWDLSLNRCLAQVNAHKGWIRCIQLLDRTVMTGSGDSIVKQWDLNLLPPATLYSEKPNSEPIDYFDSDFLLKQQFKGHSSAVSCLMFDSQKLVSGSTDKTMRYWDIETGECVSVLKFEKWIDDQFDWSSQWYTDDPYFKPKKMLQMTSSVGCLQFRGHGLAAGYSDGIIRLWDLRSGLCHRTLEGHLGAVNCLGFDDFSIISGSTDKTVKVWDLRSGSVQTEIGLKHSVSSLAFDGRRIAIAAGQRELLVYSRASGLVQEYQGHLQAVRSVSLYEDFCISGGMDGLVNIWQL